MFQISATVDSDEFHDLISGHEEIFPRQKVTNKTKKYIWMINVEYDLDYFGKFGMN